MKTRRCTDSPHGPIFGPNRCIFHDREVRALLWYVPRLPVTCAAGAGVCGGASDEARGFFLLSQDGQSRRFLRSLQPWSKPQWGPRCTGGAS